MQKIIVTAMLFLGMVSAAHAESVDVSPFISAGLQILVPIVMAIIGVVINRYVHNDEMRKALLGGLENAVKYGMARVDKAVVGKPMTVEIAVPVLAQSLNYVKQFTPKAVEWFNDKDEDIVKKLIARLPGVTGQLTESDIQRVVEMATRDVP